METHRTNLETLRDQLADLKSFFDGQMKATNVDEEFDKQNLVLKLQHSNSCLSAPS